MHMLDQFINHISGKRRFGAIKWIHNTNNQIQQVFISDINCVCRHENLRCFLLNATPTFYPYTFTMCRSHSTSFTKRVAKSVQRSDIEACEKIVLPIIRNNYSSSSIWWLFYFDNTYCLATIWEIPKHVTESSFVPRVIVPGY